MWSVVGTSLLSILALSSDRISEERLSAASQQRLAQTAISLCAAKGFHIAVAIAGPDRVVRTILSHDRAMPIAIEAARRKALTAALTGNPSAGLSKAVQEAPAYIDLLRSIEPALAPVGGGVPIRANGQLLGAIGIGGAPGPAADEACANEALAVEKLDAPR